MEKFSIFDLVGKLLSDEKGQNAIKSTLQNLYTLNNQNNQKKDVNPDKNHFSNKLSKYAIREMYKRHEEISKRINDSLKNESKR